jgi:hypothetical protein
LLLSPIQFYLQWQHQLQTGLFIGTLWDFFLAREISFGPRVFGWAGYHLWFLGFLFAYSLIALPLFLWFKKVNGHRFITWLFRITNRRGGLFLFLLPLFTFQLILRPFYPAEHDWADFIYMLFFFIYGYLLFADKRFTAVVNRDWPIMLVAAIFSTLYFFVAGALDLATIWMNNPNTPGFLITWSVWCVNGWCWTMFALYLGMRYLNFSNDFLNYWQEAILPFFLIHQPIIIIIAFYVVQWHTAVFMKIIIVVVGSFVITISIYELFIKRINVSRRLFGMKPKARTSA